MGVKISKLDSGMGIIERNSGKQKMKTGNGMDIHKASG